MTRMHKIVVLSLALALTPSFAQQAASSASTSLNGTPHIAPGSKLYIEPMNGFETYLSAAILKKKVPVLVVDSKEGADYVLTGSSHMEKAGWAKTIFVSPNAHAEASIAIKDAKSGALAYAYNVDKQNSARGNQSTAEACAKHLKEEIEKK